MREKIEAEKQEDEAAADKLNTVYTAVVACAVTTAVVIVPLLLWAAKQFLGWQPPAFVTQVIQFFGG